MRHREYVLAERVGRFIGKLNRPKKRRRRFLEDCFLVTGWTHQTRAWNRKPGMYWLGQGGAGGKIKASFHFDDVGIEWEWQ